ncbi:MAG TPA: hypothetical protein V6D17_05010 [Candidatus Obscuribacterales bacterium]
MFQSYEQLSFHQQVIVLNQTYPCPRCSSGILEPYGLTETFACNSCERGFVPLRGGRLLHPSRRMGWKVAPTFWWDGLRWHWAGTTATTKQLLTIVTVFLVPLAILNVSLYFNVWPERPEWCTPMLLTAVLGLLTIQLIYFTCWDFDFLAKRKS